MKIRLSLLSGSLALLTGLAQASPWSAQAGDIPTDLPSTVQAQAALAQEPSVVRALHALSAAGHGAAMLAASPQEWTARVTGQRRSVDGSGASREWSAQIERPFRINGKAALDQELGEVGQAIARAQLGEARHEAARNLANLWLDWQAAQRATEIAREQLAMAQANLQAVSKRRRAGDASLLDQNLALADVAETKRQLSEVEGGLNKARIHLTLRFPSLTLAAQELGTPAPLERDEPQWRERILAESDPLRNAESAVRKAELLARRFEADQVADPSVGLYTASEAAGRERVLGFSLSIPLGGSYRSQAVQNALRHADMARAELDEQRRLQEIGVAEAVADVRQGLDRWQLAEASATATRDNARMGQRAYALGEGDLQTLLQLRRLSLEAAHTAHVARVDALRAQHRLLIDAHLIWGLADD